MAAQKAQNRSRPRKDDFFVRIGLPDQTTQWFPATDFIGTGKPMPFDKPLATCAVRVYDSEVVFSHLAVTNRTRSKVANDQITMPSGALTRLARRAAELDIPDANTVIVERAIDTDDGSTVNETYVLSLRRDDANLATIELLDLTDEQAVAVAENHSYFEQAKAASLQAPDEIADRKVITLNYRGERVSIFLRSPRVDRVLGIAWLGHFQRKPGDYETIPRIAGMILNALRGVPTFQTLAEVEHVSLPALTGVSASGSPNTVQNAKLDLPVRLYTADEQPLGAGTVEVDFNLTAKVSTELGLPYTVEVDDKLDALMTDEHRTQIDFAVRTELLRHARSDIESIGFDVTLGEVDDTTVGRLDGIFAEALPGLHVKPDMYAVFATQDA